MPSRRIDDLRQLDEIERQIVKLGNELRQAEQERQAIIRRLIADQGNAASAEIDSSPKLLLTGDEAAGALSICRRTLFRLTQPRGPIPVVSVGIKGVRYSVEALRQWIERQEASDKSK